MRKEKIVIFILAALVAIMFVHIVMLYWQIGFYERLIDEMGTQKTPAKEERKGGLTLVDLRLLNGKPKCTMIQTMDGVVKVFYRGSDGQLKVKEGMNLKKALDWVTENGYEVNVSLLFGPDRPADRKHGET